MTEITKESLVAYGFVDNTIGKEPNDWHPDMMTKDLISKEWRAENADDPMYEDVCLELVYTCERNSQEFGLRTVDGIFYLGFESIEHIAMFEKAIGSYSTNY